MESCLCEGNCKDVQPEEAHILYPVFYSFAVGISDNRICSCVVTGAFSLLPGYFMPSWAFSQTPVPERQNRDVFLWLSKTIWDLFGLGTGVASWGPFWSRRKMTRYWAGMIHWEACWSLFMAPFWEERKKKRNTVSTTQLIKNEASGCPPTLNL